MAGNQVTTILKGDKKQLDSALKGAQASIERYVGYVKGALGALAGAFAIKKLFDFGSTMLEYYNTQVKAETKLAQVIKATGGAAGFTLDQFKAMASGMQEQLGVGDEVILNAQAILATFKNIRGDTFKDATVAMLDMSAVMEGDVKGAAVQLGKALNDPAKGLLALTRVGVTFTDEQKKMINVLQESGDIMGAQQIILDELTSEFGGSAKAQAETFAGVMTKLNNRLGDVYEVIGSALVPVIQSLFPVMDTALTYFANMASSLAASSVAVGEWASQFGTIFVDTFNYVIDTATTTFSWLEFFYKNWGNIWQRTTYAWVLSTVSAFEDLKHIFTAVAPAYLDWFFENWANLLLDSYNFQQTVYTNMFKNVVNFFNSVYEYLKGGKMDFEFTALTDGFEATTKKLPEIAERMKTDMESALEGNIKQMDELIGKSLNDTFQKNANAVAGWKIPPIPLEVGDPNVKPFEIAEKKLEEETEDLQKAKDAVEESTTAGSVSGLEDLAKTIQASAIQGRKDKEEAEKKETAAEKKKREKKEEDAELLAKAQGLAPDATEEEEDEAIDAKEQRRIAILAAREAERTRRKEMFEASRRPMEVKQRGLSYEDKLDKAMSRVKIPDNAPVVKVLNDIKEFYPKMIQKLGQIGGLT